MAEAYSFISGDAGSDGLWRAAGFLTHAALAAHNVGSLPFKMQTHGISLEEGGERLRKIEVEDIERVDVSGSDSSALEVTLRDVGDGRTTLILIGKDQLSALEMTHQILLY